MGKMQAGDNAAEPTAKTMLRVLQVLSVKLRDWVAEDPCALVVRD
jgi:hypothetical protein